MSGRGHSLAYAYYGSAAIGLGRPARLQRPWVGYGRAFPNPTEGLIRPRIKRVRRWKIQPEHGPPADHEALMRYRDMLVNSVRSRPQIEDVRAKRRESVASQTRVADLVELMYRLTAQAITGDNRRKTRASCKPWIRTDRTAQIRGP